MLKAAVKSVFSAFFLNSAGSAMVHRSSDNVFHAQGLVYEKARSQNFRCSHGGVKSVNDVEQRPDVYGRQQWVRQCSSDMLDTSQ